MSQAAATLRAAQGGQALLAPAATSQGDQRISVGRAQCTTRKRRPSRKDPENAVRTAIWQLHGMWFATGHARLPRGFNRI